MVDISVRASDRSQLWGLPVQVDPMDNGTFQSELFITSFTLSHQQPLGEAFIIPLSHTGKQLRMAELLGDELGK